MASTKRHTLHQEIKDRKGALKEIQAQLRKLDSAVEKAQRLIVRLRGRKTKLPNLKDLLDLIEILDSKMGLKGTFNLVLKAVEIARDIFEAF